MGAVLQARTIDVTKIRAAVERLGVKPIKEHLFPVIADAPVSKDKTPSDQMSTAIKVRDALIAFGVSNARIIEHPGCYPAVYGSLEADLPNAPTILIGGHYDGQPSMPREWNVTQPHKPKIVTQGGETRVFGRGTSDDWGQVLTHLMAVKMIRSSGAQLPARLIFFIEGGEEEGSKNMDEMIRANKHLLECDLVLLTDSSPGRVGVPVITTLGRGLVSAKVRLKLGDNSLHSGVWSIMPGANEILDQVLALKDLMTQKVLIPGFYNDVVQLSDAERAHFAAMPLDIDTFKRDKGLRIVRLPPGLTAQETLWAQPTYQKHTINGPDGKEPLAPSNTIYTDACAYVSMRVVPNQDPNNIFRLFKEEVYRRLDALNIPPEFLTIEPESFAYPFLQDTSGPMFATVAESMASAFGVASSDFMGCGGSEPIAIHYQAILGVDVVFNAYNSPLDNYHASDESFSITHGFYPGVAANALIYLNLYKLRNAARP